MWTMYERTRDQLVIALLRLEALAEGPVGGPPNPQLPEIAKDARRLLQVLKEQTGPLPSTEPAPQLTDPRILRTVGKLRLVAPQRRPTERSKAPGVYLNGVLLIERRETDALGAERWVAVTSIRWAEHPSGIINVEPERAIFRLLAGDGWDDRELREYDK